MGRASPREDLPRVFDRFDRLDEAAFAARRRSASGLPLTRQFIEAHGGTVELEFQARKGHHGHPRRSRAAAMILQDEEATTAASARALARHGASRDVITLSGPLGVGKTAFARGFISALGHEGEVPSPSFAIVQPYEELKPPVWHVDLYRMEDSVGDRGTRARCADDARPPGRMARAGRTSCVAGRARFVARLRDRKTRES